MLALALQATSAPPARAEPSPPSAATTPDTEAIIASPEYKELVREGMLKYTRGFWEEALAYFRKAHELAPNARTLRGLALVCYDSHRYVEAIDYAEQALHHSVQPLNERMSADLAQLLQQAQAVVAHVQLVTHPAAAELRIDGKPLARRADGDILVDPGPHHLTVSAQGFVTNTRRLEFAEGSQYALRVELSPRTAAAAARVATAQPRATAPASSSAVPWVVIGASAAVAATGGILIAIDQRDGSSTMTSAGAVLLAVGGLGLAAGLTWRLWPSAEPERAHVAQLRVGPAALHIRATF